MAEAERLATLDKGRRFDVIACVIVGRSLKEQQP
jgi:hypothetical protein